MTPAWVDEVLRLYPGRIDGDEVSIRVCPFCGNAKSNCQLNFVRQVYHCWACGAGGSTRSFLRKFGIAFEDGDVAARAAERTKDPEALALPPNISVLHTESAAGKRAISYLRNRGVSEQEMLDWDIRFGNSGDWAGWTLFPLYGLRGLEYFQGLNSGMEKKYRFPAIGKDHYVPKLRGETGCIVLVEGIFDALNVWRCCRNDVMPLFGKFVGDNARAGLIASNYEKVYVCLDGDARKEAIALAELLRRAGCRPWFVSMPDDKDPDEAGSNLSYYLAEAVEFTEISAARLRRSVFI